MRAAEVLDAHLLVVTGKGGTGKTSVAAALAVTAAAKGHRVLLAEVEGRQGLARLFDLPALAHDGAPIGEGISGLAIDPRASLREYLERTGVPVLGTLLNLAGLSDLVTAAAPGLGDALLVGKVWEATRSGEWDLVVLDAPPTGRVVPFLRAPETVAALARMGPLGQQAEPVARLLTDPERTRVVITTLPEALPVAETLETADTIAEAGFALGIVVANQVAPDGLDDDAGRLPALAADPAPLLAAAARAGIELAEPDARALAEEALEAERRIGTQRLLLGELRAALDAEVVELPLLPRGVTDPAGVKALARHLRQLGPRAKARAR